MPKQMYMAITSGSAEVNGDVIQFVKNQTIVADGHGLLAACPDYFTPLEEHQHFETTDAPPSDAPKSKSKKAG